MEVTNSSVRMAKIIKATAKRPGSTTAVRGVRTKNRTDGGILTINALKALRNAFLARTESYNHDYKSKNALRPGVDLPTAWQEPYQRTTT